MNYISLILIGIAVFLSFIRLLIGPTSSDRLLASDTLATITTALLVFMAVFFDRLIYMDVAIVYAVLGFVGIVTVARYMEGGI
ncbi:MAG: cation:proton antiporter [Spirochaetes bacterium]|nr:MAG: cation:proton antiporter [Spirochaetota bacterium]